MLGLLVRAPMVLTYLHVYVVSANFAENFRQKNLEILVLYYHIYVPWRYLPRNTGFFSFLLVELWREHKA